MNADDIIGAGLEPQLCLTTLSLVAKLSEAFPEPDSVARYPQDQVDPSDEKFLKLLYTNTAMFLRLVPDCSDKQLLDGAESLGMLCIANINAKKQYLFKGNTTQAIRMGRKVTMARLITDEGECSCRQ